jgi:HK97 gp10 family phage protein
MAKTNTVRIEGLQELDAKLKKIALEFRTSKSTSIVNKGLRKGAAHIRKTVKQATPKSKSGTTGNVTTPSRNHPAGTLRKAMKSEMVKRIRKRNTFMAVMGVEHGRGAKNDGWYAGFPEHGFAGFARSNKNKDFFKKAVKRSSSQAVSIVEQTIRQQINTI